MKRGCRPAALVPGGLLLLAGVGPAGRAFSLPAEPQNELFAIQIVWGDGSLEFPYGFLDPETLEFKQPRVWRYQGPGVLDTVSAVDPLGARFFLIGSGSLLVIDAATAAA